MTQKENPIFTTEDGVKYYNKEDLVWDIHDFDKNGPAARVNPSFLDQTEVKYAMTLSKDRKFFSTQKAAENYRACHIKCLSFNDVWNMTCDKDENKNYTIINKKDLIFRVRNCLKIMGIT